MSVAGAEYGRYFWTASAVKPGYVENCLLLISFSSACFGVLNVASCRYLMSAALNAMANVLYSMCLLFIVSIIGDVEFQSCNGNIHNCVCSSLPPFHTILLL